MYFKEKPKKCGRIIPKKDAVKGPNGRVSYSYTGYDPKKAIKSHRGESYFQLFEVETPNGFNVREVMQPDPYNPEDSLLFFTTISDSNSEVSIRKGKLGECISIESSNEMVYKGNKITFDISKLGESREVSALSLEVEDQKGNKSKISTVDTTIDEEYGKYWEDKIGTKITGDKFEEHMGIVRAMLQESQDPKIDFFGEIFNALENRDLDGVIFRRGFGRNSLVEKMDEQSNIKQRSVFDKLSGVFDKLVEPTMEKFYALPHTKIGEVQESLNGTKESARKFLEVKKPEMKFAQANVNLTKPGRQPGKPTMQQPDKKSSEKVH